MNRQSDTHIVPHHDLPQTLHRAHYPPITKHFLLRLLLIILPRTDHRPARHLDPP
jgi:hypothetical protein